MARTVHLHIGLPKTGTTFLQTTMWQNRPALRRQGFLYPGASRMDHYHSSQEVRGASPARMGRNAGAWKRLVGELAAWDGDGLVSHEFFSMATADQARAAVAALAPAEVRLVVTVRSYVLQFPAVWQEALKMPSDLGFDAFMDRALAGRLRGGWSWQSQDIPRVLGHWAQAVPADRITVVTVPPPGAPRGLLWQRWTEAIGIDDSAFDLDVSYANESLGAAQAALLTRVKPYLSGPLEQGPVRHRWVRKYFGHEVLVPQRGERFGPRPHHVTELAARSTQARDWLAERGFRVVGDLEDLASTTTPGGPHPDDVPDEEIVEVAARAIERMIRDVRDLTMERDRLRAELHHHRVRHEPVAGARAVLRRVRRALGR
ncbi:hypothetical protein [Nocardioides sp. TF02-7]|uniref:hypothetical protein n=1 Tax=Nocardioides sp. TF02-7 TaxID=2917724 RepID=UPI001F05B783|nr:hypothetical protein [Nocardioides sp. TF02-7]UMG93200.1 hypothetical protein MF408_02535 [Nocardioides sp. TF02-7]